MSKILIYEKLNDVKTLEKGRGEDGFMRLKGTFGVCGVRNNNNRVYEASNYKSMVDRIKTRIVSEGVPGQLEHPQTMNIDLNEVSHMIEDINIDEAGVVTGTIKLLDTPKGKIAQALVEGGLPLFISSRATGSIDKATGKVTLEDLKTYDLVGTPGFSQARLNLAESQYAQDMLGTNLISESIDDNMFIIEAKETSDPANQKENNFEMTEQEHKELLDKIDLLEKEVKNTNKKIDESQSPERMRLLAEAIQNWVINEYSPNLQNWVTEAITDTFDTSIREGLLQQVATGVQNWTLKEMAPEIQNWLTEHYGEDLKANMIETMSNGIQGWIIEQYSPELQKWVAEEYTKTVESWINEHLRDDIMSKVNESISSKITENKESKFASVDRILEMIDQNPNKPVVGRINENLNPEEPLFIRNMPAAVRPLWESADENMKNFIQRKAKLYNFSSEAAIENFWENIDWKKQVSNQPVYEGLESISDPYERNLRMQLRRHTH